MDAEEDDGIRHGFDIGVALVDSSPTCPLEEPQDDRGCEATGVIFPEICKREMRSSIKRLKAIFHRRLLLVTEQILHDCEVEDWKLSKLTCDSDPAFGVDQEEGAEAHKIREGGANVVPADSQAKKGRGKLIVLQADSTRAPSKDSDESSDVVMAVVDVGMSSDDSPGQAKEEVQGTSVTTPARRRISLRPDNRISRSLRHSVSALQDHMFTPCRDRTDSAGILLRLANSWFFESVASFVILCNCATMGLQAHVTVTDGDIGRHEGLAALLEISEHIFTAFFLIEFLFRFYIFGWRTYWPSDGETFANFLDAFLVIFTGVVVTWLVPLYSAIVGGDSDNGVFRFLTLLRAVRLVRLVRVFRKVPLFREAWLLVRGINDSVRTLFWTIVVVFFVTYAFGIFGLLTIVQSLQVARLELGNTEEGTKLDTLLAMINGMDKLMYTLVQVLTQDSFHSFMREIMAWEPLSWLYFYAYIAIACLVLMNLVTAIIVENAMETSRNDHEQLLLEKADKRSRQMKELKHLFHLMDSDGSGTLSWDEFRESFSDMTMAKMWMLLDFQPDECRQLFNLLDDGDGEIETNEFFEGLTRMKGAAQAKDVYRLQKTVNKLLSSLEEANVISPRVDSYTFHSRTSLSSTFSAH